VAGHDWEDHEINLLEHDFGQHWNGQNVNVGYKVGGGGGHQLFVEKVKLDVRYTKSKWVEDTVNEEIEEFHADDEDDDWHDFFKVDFNRPTKELVSGSLSFDWVDQGFGNQKGAFMLQLIGKHNFEHVIEVAPHEQENVTVDLKEFEELNHFKFRRAKGFYRCGGGGGHQIKFNNLNFTVTYTHKPQ